MKPIKKLPLYFSKSSVVLVLLLLLLSLIISPEMLCSSTVTTSETMQEKEIYLVRSEHYFYINATDNIDTFHIKYSFPPNYAFQVPIYLELINDTTVDIIHYCIENEEKEPNTYINFTIGSMEKNESAHLHFYSWVLIKNYKYQDLPGYVQIPKKRDLPEETKIWLQSSEVVQTKSILLRLKARQLRGLNTNLLVLAQRIATFTRYHRYLLFILQFNLGLLGPQDALTTLLRNGECPGRSHLGCALFRINNVPARVILATPHYDFWYQIHCMTEYYLPEYGWILTEVHGGKTPYEPKNQIILRICYPEDEDNTHTDYIFPRMKGIENWFWIDNDSIIPYYKDFIGGSKSNMFMEQMTVADSFSADYSFFITQTVFYLYQLYLGMELLGENLQHFENATTYQRMAIQQFISSANLQNYLIHMDLGYTEFMKINIGN